MQRKKPSANELLVDALIKKIEENNILPWQSQHLSEGLPYNHNTGNTYSGRNLLLLMCGNYNHNGFMTYRQAASLGYQVRKGEKGLPIVWAQNKGLVQYERENEQGVMQTYTKWNKGGARAYYVFNVSQIDGIPEMPSGTTADRPDVEAWLKKLPVKWERGNNPCYYPLKDTIGIPYVEDFTNTDEYYSTLFHELIHWTGHVERLARGSMNHPRNRDADTFEELVAEIGSAFLRGSFCIKSKELDDENAAYVKWWLDRIHADKMMILTAATEAQRAVDYLMYLGMPEQEPLTVSAVLV